MSDLRVVYGIGWPPMPVVKYCFFYEIGKASLCALGNITEIAMSGTCIKLTIVVLFIYNGASNKMAAGLV